MNQYEIAPTHSLTLGRESSQWQAEIEQVGIHVWRGIPSHLQITFGTKTSWA